MKEPLKIGDRVSFYSGSSSWHSIDHKLDRVNYGKLIGVITDLKNDVALISAMDGPTNVYFAKHTRELRRLVKPPARRRCWMFFDDNGKIGNYSNDPMLPGVMGWVEMIEIRRKK